MSASDVEKFAWRHLARRLEQAGLGSLAGDLAEWVSIERQTLPGDSTPAPAADTADGPTVQRLVRLQPRLRRGDFLIELNAHDGDLMSWMCGLLAEGDAPPPDPTAALRTAEQAVTLPPGAVLASSGYEDVGGHQTFVAHWEHREDHVLVERDYLRVLVSGRSGRVFAVQKRWHVVDFDWGER